MDSDPATVSPTFVVPTVVDEPEAAGLHVAGTRDQEFLEFVRASGRYLLHTAVLLCAVTRSGRRSWSRSPTSARIAPGARRATAIRRRTRRVLVNLRIDGWRRTR